MNYCDCRKYNPKDHWGKFRIVQVDENGICLDCGHYTLIAPPTANYSHSNKTHNNSKYSEETIKEVLRLLETDLKQTEIAEKLGVNKSLVSKVKTGRAWTNVTI